GPFPFFGPSLSSAARRSDRCRPPAPSLLSADGVPPRRHNRCNPDSPLLFRRALAIIGGTSEHAPRRPVMEMILCDWTRMGRAYCLAGPAPAGDRWTFVRPILHNRPTAPVPNVGWSPFLLDGHCRWEVFDLVGQQAPP